MPITTARAGAIAPEPPPPGPTERCAVGSQASVPDRPSLRVVPVIALALVVVLGPLSPTSSSGDDPSTASFVVEPPLSTDGVYRLRWHVDGEVRLDESVSPDFVSVTPIYSGSDNATTLTGRADGTYYYRLRAIGADPNEASVVSVEVRHHALGRALAYFFVGLVVFVATVGVLLRGHASDARA